MKAEFPGYFKLSDVALKKIWQEAFFALDANFLLNAYRYSPETRAEVFKIIEVNRDRIWIPHQAALEFLEGRLGAIKEADESYDSIRKSLDKLQDDFKASRHPFISETLFKELADLFEKITKDLENRKAEFINFANEDPIQERVAELLEGRIGAPYSESDLRKTFDEGEKRYKAKIPPGYEDIKKPDDGKYGDLVLWYQLIERAKQEKKPVIFITGDEKEDWWRIFKGKKIGPQPKLVAEMKTKAAVDFYMYVPDQFLEFARTLLNQEVTREAIAEVKEIRKHGEEDKARAFTALSHLVLESDLMHKMSNSISFNKKVSDMLSSPILERIRQEDDFAKQLLAAATPLSGLATAESTIAHYLKDLNRRYIDPLKPLVSGYLPDLYYSSQQPIHTTGKVHLELRSESELQNENLESAQNELTEQDESKDT